MTQDRQELTGKVALITGAARRVGAQIARSLHAEGMDLVLHYQSSQAAAEALKSELELSRPDSVMLFQANLERCIEFPGLIERVRAFRGRLDVLVNNASSFYPTPLGDASEDQWDQLMGSNLKGPFFLTKEAAPMLRSASGCVINLVDIYALRPLGKHPIYSIAKAGNAMMVKALARELGPHVRVNGVAPGVILWPEKEPGDATKVKILARTALKRAGTPLDVVRTILFLIRDADYITGQVIAVDGGRTLQQ
jgi:pteridine reductase